MRVTAALTTAGLATLGLLALAPAASAQAVPTAGTSVSVVAGWQAIAKYPNYRRCVDAGQQYVREGFNAWDCRPDGPSGEYWLFVR
ncbi:hypothetical protein OHA70_07175 [Kribbella sp. NBC_00382]|uniref:hypothetical protein n=1 Tax=Kribbella sp. NBC_00382 TaxID=2975967 RepID=UPI002E1D59C5